MAEETLPSNVPIVEVHPASKGKTQTPAEGQIAAKKSTVSRPAGKPVSRQQKLILHLLIGLLMSISVIAGYAFLGPGASANAADLAHYPMVDVTTHVPTGTNPQTPVIPTVDSGSTSSDLAALQAEMAKLTRQMNAIQAAGVPVSSSKGAGSSAPGIAGQGQSSPSPMQSKLDEMMAMTHDMLNKMNSMNGQASGMSSQLGGAGHAAHH